MSTLLKLVDHLYIIIRNAQNAVRGSVSNGYKSQLTRLPDAITDEAEEVQKKISLELRLRLNPDDMQALCELGLMLFEGEFPREAAVLFRHAIDIDPTLTSIYGYLGKSLYANGKYEEAAHYLNTAIKLDPDDQVAHKQMAGILRSVGRFAESEQHYREALRLTQDNADVHIDLGTVLYDQKKLQEAEQSFRAALKIQPNHWVALCNLGQILADRGLLKDAEKCFLAAMDANPSYVYARLSYVMNKLPIIPNDDFERVASRSEYAQALSDFCGALPLDDTACIQSTANVVGWLTPFYLAYQGMNDRELQAMYGTFICDVMRRQYKEFSTRPPMPSLAVGTPIRVGIVSAFFYDHSNWKALIRGWLENMDATRFQVYCYYTRTTIDADTELAKKASHSFVMETHFEQMAKIIRGDDLHVLIYPEIGMDPLTVKLASLHLAPVQCNSWGHPITSGMPTIDYYLSSDLMEPANGQQYYSEKLVRLPNLSVYYTAPMYETTECNRGHFGLNDDDIVYYCSQSLFKYLPQLDSIFTSIAKKVKNAQFIFFAAQQSDELTERFIERLSRQFEKEGLPFDRHVRMMPRLKTGKFQALAKICDIYLDSVEWSGCNTTLEVLAYGLPVITCDGSMMRGRHTLAFLKMLGFEELIASDVASYIDLSVKLGLDPTWRNQIRAEIPIRLPKLYEDLECIRELESFLYQAIKDYHQ